MATPIYISTNGSPSFPFSASSPALDLFDDSCSNRCGVVPHCDFDFHFLMMSDAGQFFMYFWPSACFFWKNVCSDLLPILKLVCLFAIELYEFFIYFGYFYLITYDLQIFSPIH